MAAGLLPSDPHPPTRSQHKFSGEKTSTLDLSAQARQFSSFIVMVGTLPGRDAFQPQYAAILTNKDDLTIPLELSTIPTPKGVGGGRTRPGPPHGRALGGEESYAAGFAAEESVGPTRCSIHPLAPHQEFRDATRSLSPEQREFAKMFRGMQLASTLFAVLVVESEWRPL